MNEVALKGLVKIVKSIISPAQIHEAANSILKSAIDFKDQIELKKNETQVAGIIYEIGSDVYAGVAVLDSDNKITRVENIKPFNEIISDLINKM